MQDFDDEIDDIEDAQDKDESTYYITFEMNLSEPGFCNSCDFNPAMEIRPDNIDADTERKFIAKSVELMRLAFESARKSAAIKAE